MGSCFGKCVTWKRRLSNFKKTHIARFKESNSMIEFESLIGEDEQSIYPQSIDYSIESEHYSPFYVALYLRIKKKDVKDVVLPHEKSLLHAGRLDILSDVQKLQDEYLYEQFRRKEEALEFNEEYFYEDVSESGSMEIISPRQLLLKNCDKSLYNAGENSHNEDEDFDEFLNRVRARTLAAREQPLILSVGSLLKNDSSTTQSSLELDWESEGLTYPQEIQNTDDDLPTTKTETTSIRSHHDSNSLLNDLEWDEDVFLGESESARQNVDNETDILIEEIERLTSRALKETGPNR